MNILEHPLVLRYFGCDDEIEHYHLGSPCVFICRNVLTAMQEPIKKGKRFLCWRKDKVTEEISASGENSLGVGYVRLRLPSRFQPQEPGDKPTVYCRHCGGNNPLTAPARDGVEEEISRIIELQGSRKGAWLESHLRNLVALARGTK